MAAKRNTSARLRWLRPQLRAIKKAYTQAVESDSARGLSAAAAFAREMRMLRDEIDAEVDRLAAVVEPESQRLTLEEQVARAEADAPGLADVVLERFAAEYHRRLRIEVWVDEQGEVHARRAGLRAVG